MKAIMVSQGPEETGLKPWQPEVAGGENFDYSQRSQWLRAVVLGGIQGIVATALLIMGVGTFMHDMKPLIITGLAGLVAGALGTAVAEFVSVCTQVDIAMSQEDRDKRMGREGLAQRVAVPSPTQVAMAASLAYAVAGMVPLVAAGLISDPKLRFSVAAAMTCLSMLGLGNIGAVLGKAPVARHCARVLVGGFVEIMILWAKGKVLEVYGLGETRSSISWQV